MQAAETTPRLTDPTWCAPNRETCEERQGAKGETIMSTGPKGTEQDSIAQCSVCGRSEALFELPEEQRNAVWSAVQTWQRPSCE